MKKQFRIYFIIAFLVGISGCAYFNTFYNAKQYFKKAQHETRRNRTGKPTSTETSNYTKAIEKASKLIDMYPDSKWVDDALILLSKSYYYRGQYLNSQRKLLEFKTNFPESELIPEADLWMAKNDVMLKNYVDAKSNLDKMLAGEADDHLKSLAYFELGRLHQEQENYGDAVEALEQSAAFKNEEIQIDVLLTLGLNYDSLRVYDRAADAYAQVIDLDPILEIRFEADFKYAQMQKMLKNYDESIRLFERLLVDDRNKKSFPDMQLEIAECLALKGETDEAILSYQDIMIERKKSAFSAMASYRLGKIYEEVQHDYDRALDSFAQVTKEYRASPVADSAETRKRDIQRLQALQQVVNMVQRGETGELVLAEEEVEEDTLTDEMLYAKIDSATTDSLRYKLLLEIAGETFVDSMNYEQRVARRNIRVDDQRRDNRRTEIREKLEWHLWIEDGELSRNFILFDELMKLEQRRRREEKAKLTDNPELKSFSPDELDRNLFLLAELYLFRFERPDSAVNHYHRILDQFPDSPFAPQAMYNLSYVHREYFDDFEASAEYRNDLLELYPNSRFALAALREQGEQAETGAVDSLQLLFKDAESTLFDTDDALTAFHKYETIWQKYPESDLAPKAAYAMAWIGENRLDSLQLAYSVYDSLSRQFPETVYAEKAKPKLDAFLQAKADEEARANAPADSLSAVSDSSAVAMMDSVQIPADSLGVPVETMAVETDSAASEAQIDKKAIAALLPENKGTGTGKGERPPQKRPQEQVQKQPNIQAREEMMTKEREEEGADDIRPGETDPSPLGGINGILNKIKYPGGIPDDKKQLVLQVRVHVDDNGMVLGKNFVEATPDSLLNAEILNAIQRTRFQPGTQNGVPVQKWFRLNLPLRKEDASVER